MGEGKASTLGVVAAVTGKSIAVVVRAMTFRAISNVGRTVAVGTTATERAVGLIWAPPIIGVAARITTSRDPNVIISTMVVCTGGAEESVGTRTWAEIELLLTTRLAARELGSRRDLVAVGLEHIEQERTSRRGRGVGNI